MSRREKEKSLKTRGLGKLLHRLFLFVTFPIRHPGIFIPVLIVAYLAPTFMGAKPAEVHLWYWNKIKHNTDTLSSAISEKTQAIMPMVDNINISMPNIESLGLSSSKPIEQVVDIPQNNPQNIRRKMFEKAQGDLETIDALKNAQRIDPQFKTSEQPVSTTAANVSRSGDSGKKLALIYVEQKEEIVGTARVVNANEIEMNGKSYFMHGIYVDPNTQKGLEAKNFLRNMIGENTIRCVVQAYTYQGVGTLRCFLGGEDINLTMVNKGYSRNVALD